MDRIARITRRDDVTAIAAALAAAVAAFVVAWSPVDFLVVAGAIFAFALVFRASDRTVLFLVGLSFPFEGLRLTVPAFQDAFLLRFFPDGIDLPVGYAFALIAIAAVLLNWLLALSSRRLPKPRLPLVLAAALFWGSAALSSISADDPLLTLKYAAYPIAFSYVAYVLLPAQLVRVKEDVLALVRGMVAAGAVAAAMGVASLFSVAPGAAWMANPIQVFGVWPIGDNHNLLAETLVATAPLALILSLGKKGRERFLLRALAAAMALVALLTFARTAWIALAAMAVVAVAYEYRRELRRRLWSVVLVGLLLVPLAALLAVVTSTPEAGGSTASRLVMTEFSLYLFGTHPIVGAGAGTFLDRLGQAQAFTSDFGAPLDAHGFGQKILAEQGIIGMVLFLYLLGRILQTLFGAVRASEPGSDERRALLLFAVAALGMMIYEGFNTTYYSPKMWLPIGAALAALPAWTGRKTPIV